MPDQSSRSAKQKAPWYTDLRFFVILFAIFFAFLMMSMFGGDHSAGPGGGIGSFVSGKDAPDIEFATLDGKIAKLSDYKGKVILLNFWATWCSPCRQEVPMIQSLHKKYLDQPDFVVLAVACDENAKDIREYVQKNAVTFPTFHDEGMKAAEIYGVDGFPETFLIDRDGKIVHKFVGPRQWDDPSFRAQFDELLAKKSE